MLCQKDSRQEGAEYDKHVIGVFKPGDKLVDQMPIELLNLIDSVLGNTEENRVSAVIADQMKRKFGLVVPPKCDAFIKDLKTPSILQQGILKRKSKYSQFELDFSIQKLVKSTMLRKE